MDYIQFFTLFGTMLAGFGFIYREFKTSQSELRNDLQNFESEIRNDIKIQSGFSLKIEIRVLTSFTKPKGKS